MKGMELLGLKVQDRVTGATGIATAISYDLYGCIQAIITPDVKTKDGKEIKGWYDVGRLKILSKTPVLDLPDFADEKGPEDKPIL